MTLKRRIIIYTPRQHSGGPIVLHVLAKGLSELGYDVRVLYSEVSYKEDCDDYIKFLFNWLVFISKDFIKFSLSKIDKKNRVWYNGFRNCTIKKCKRKYLPFVKKTDIVIYPEIVFGNPLNAQNVVRYLLYYYKYKNEENAYSKKDLFISFREEFNDSDLNSDNFILTIPYYNLDYYKRTNFGERHGKCYIVRKGKDRDDLPESYDGIIIDNLPEDDKIKTFNECEYCISYDVQTAYSSLAALCGCISVIIPYPGETPETYRNSDDPKLGVAVGFSNAQIQYAKETVDALRNQYEEYNNETIEKIKLFADKLEEYFN